MEPEAYSSTKEVIQCTPQESKARQRAFCVNSLKVGAFFSTVLLFLFPTSPVIVGLFGLAGAMLGGVYHAVSQTVSCNIVPLSQPDNTHPRPLEDPPSVDNFKDVEQAYASRPRVGGNFADRLLVEREKEPLSNSR